MSTDALPSEGDQLEAETIEAPDTGTSQNEGFQAPFNINDIEDQQVREHVERYQKQLQGAYTKKTQENARERDEYLRAQRDAEAWQRVQSDPAAQQELLKQLAELQGYQLPEDDQDDVSVVDQLAREVAELKAAHQAGIEQQAQQSQVAHVEQLIGTQLDQFGVTDEDEREVIVALSLTSDPTADGLPDIEKAVERFREKQANFQKAWRNSKKAPSVSRGGAAGQKQVDLSDKDQRQALMLAHLQAASED